MAEATSDKDYADLLARLQAVPTQQPERQTYTQDQQRAHLVEDLIEINGEATW